MKDTLKYIVLAVATFIASCGNQIAFAQEVIRVPPGISIIDLAAYGYVQPDGSISFCVYDLTVINQAGNHWGNCFNALQVIEFIENPVTHEQREEDFRMEKKLQELGVRSGSSTEQQI